MNYLDKQNKECNYTGYLKNYVTYPPNGLLPVPGDNVEFTPGCDLWTEIYEAALIINPAFNIYRIFDQVSLLIFPKLLVQFLIHSSVVATPVGRPGLPVRHCDLPSVRQLMTASVYSEATESPIYFDREDVKKAIHAPVDKTWLECTDINVFPNGDDSLPPTFTVLPNVIEQSVRSVIMHGLGDYVLIAEGARIALQK